MISYFFEFLSMIDSPYYNFVFIIDFLGKDAAVFFIYDFLFFCLLITHYLVFDLFLYPIKKDKTKKYEENLQLFEFSVNFPLVLGVMGTLISIGSVVISQESGVSSQEVSKLLFEGLSSAITTTILGGAVYGYSYLLQALTHKHAYN